MRTDAGQYDTAVSTSELHAGALLVAQGFQAHHRVFAQALHLIGGVNVVLAMAEAVQEKLAIRVHILDRFERVLPKPPADPSHNSLMQEEIRKVRRLR